MFLRNFNLSHNHSAFTTQKIEISMEQSHIWEATVGKILKKLYFIELKGSLQFTQGAIIGVWSESD
jgi:hypothetical protein